MSDSFKRVVFISGMISDDKDYQEKFAEAEKTLTEQGYIVLNPVSVIPSDCEWNKAMKLCMKMIESCNMVCFLPDWVYSKGARKEYIKAINDNKYILFYNDKNFNESIVYLPKIC